MYVSIQTFETWPKPNYINPETRGNSVIIIHSILYSLVVVVFGLRIFTRARISRCFGADDTFILIAMIPTTAFVGVMITAQVKYNWNRHGWDVIPAVVTIGGKLVLISQLLFAVASTCTRLSMLFLTRRILVAGYERLQKIIIFTIVLMGVDCLIFVTMAIFQCRPISAYWTLSFVPQHCINENLHLTIHGSLNILFDFCAVLIPIPIVLSLNLPLRQRIIVALLFGIGFVVCLAGIVRTYYMYKATAGYHDVTWDAYPAWLATAVELYLGIFCASAPPTKPFFARYIPKLLSATRSQEFTFASSQNTFTPICSLSQGDQEGSVGLEFDHLSRKRSEIHKTVEIEVSQSRSDATRTPDTFSTGSVVKPIY